MLAFRTLFSSIEKYRFLLTTDECENNTNNSNIESRVQEEDHQKTDESNHKESVSFIDKDYDLLSSPTTSVDDVIKRDMEELMRMEMSGLSPVNYPHQMPPLSFHGTELGHPSHYNPYQASSSCSPYLPGASSEDSSKHYK